MELHAGGDGLGLDLLQPGLHFLAYLDDVGAGLGGDEQADGRLSVVLHGVAHGCLPAVGDIGHVLIAVGDVGHVGELELVVLVPLDDEVAYVVYASIGIAHLYLHPAVRRVKVSGIDDGVLGVEGGQQFGWVYSEVGHAVGLHVYVDAAGALPVGHGFCHSVYIADLTAYHVSVPSGLAVSVSVKCESVETGFRIIDLAAEHVPFLLGGPVRSGGLESYRDDGHVVEGLGCDRTYLVHPAYRLLQRPGDFQFRLVCRRSGIDCGHYGDLDLDLRVLELAHAVVGEGSAHDETDEYGYYEYLVLQCIFCNIHGCRELQKITDVGG